MKSLAFKILLFIVLFCTLFNALFKDEARLQPGHWHSNLHADQVGYYVYLPALFQYSIKGNFPKEVEKTMGDGFYVDSNKAVITRYTYGVALLESPFYLAGLGVCKLFSIENNGISYSNHLAIGIAGICYAILGLLILYGFLCKYFSPGISLFTALLVFFATGTCYYSLFAMSHIYSFFLFNLAFYCFKNYLDTRSKWQFFFVALCMSLIILIRPFNIIIGIPLLLLDVNKASQIMERLKLVFSLRNILVFALVFAAVWAPQFCYWKYVHGAYFYDSYAGQSFEYLTNPKVMKVLFEPFNGLLPYNPIYLFIFLSMFFWFKHQRAGAVGLLLSVLLLIYISAAWWTYTFGCGYSARNFNEFSGVLCLPLAGFLQDHFKKWKAILLTLGLGACLYVNLHIITRYDICFWGKIDWDWNEYKYLLLMPSKSETVNMKQNGTATIVKLNGEEVYYMSAKELYSPGLAVEEETWPRMYKRARVSMDVLPVGEAPKASVVAFTLRNDTAVGWNGHPISEKPYKWYHSEGDLVLPVHESGKTVVKVFVTKNEGEKIFIKNFKVKLY